MNIASQFQPGATCILPVKRLAAAKSRLAGLLSPDDRAALQRAMLGDILAVLAETASIADIVVVSNDASVAELAGDMGATCIAAPEADLSMCHAVEIGIERAHRTSGSGSAVMILPADVPLADPQDLDALIERSVARHSVQIVPDGAGAGTNALVLPRPVAGLVAFGEASFRRHLDRARACGIRADPVEVASLMLDIDRPVDLFDLVAATPGDTAHHTAGWLKRNGYHRPSHPRHASSRRTAQETETYG